MIRWAFPGGCAPPLTPRQRSALEGLLANALLWKDELLPTPELSSPPRVLDAMRWLTAWLRTTFDYNPTFPLSALLLLVGLRLLGHRGALDAETLAGAAGGLGVLQGYELLLLGAALLVLWPRRIVYETTSILVILTVVRWAAPFVVTGFAADAEAPLGAALLGAGVAGLMTWKVRAVQRAIGLDLTTTERAWDGVLYGAASIGLPVLAWWLAAATGRTLEHDAARLIHVGAWWGAALLVAPLALGLPELGLARRPLGSRRPAAVWRDLGAIAFPLLLGNALWLGGEGPTPAALLPLAVVVPAVLLAHARAAGLDPGAWTAHLPAAAVLVAAFAPQAWLLGRVPVAPRGGLLLALLPLAALTVPLVSPDRLRLGLRSVAVAAALAPFAVAPTLRDAEAYLLLAAATLAVAGAVARRGEWLAFGALAAAPLVAHLGEVGLGGSLLGASGLVALVAALRLPADDLAARAPLVVSLLVVAAEQVAGGPPHGGLVGAALADGLALTALGLRRGERGSAALGAAVGLSVAGRAGLSPALAAVDPGLALVLLAFAAVPAGTWIAVRRERGEAARRLLEPEAWDPDAPEVEAVPAGGGRATRVVSTSS